MSDSGHDDDFEAYLKRRVPIHKSGNPPERLEPPPELDRIIIGNARQAIQGAAPVPVYRAPRWALAVGLAATILISFAVVLELGLRAKPVAAPEQPVAADFVAAAKLPPIPTTPWPPDAKLNTAPAVAADTAERISADKARTRLAREEAATSRSRSDTAPEAPSGSTLEETVVTSKATVPQPPSPAPAPPPPPAHLDPATWLSQIEKLRGAGQMAEAERQIERFHEVYPDYPVPGTAASADGRTQ